MPKDDHLSNELSISGTLTKSGVSVAAKSRAVAAFDRLLGSALDIPVARLESVADQIRARSEQEIRLIVAKGDAEFLEHQEEFGRGAAQDMLARHLKKTANKKKIADKAIEFLNDDDAPQEESDEVQEIEEDWLNWFENYAEKASTDQMQIHWARVLAGEIRKPKSFSLATLRFLAEVDQDIANLFERETEYWIDGGFILKPKELKSQHLLDMTFLEEVGLLQEVNGNLQRTITSKSSGRVFIWEGNYGLALKIKSTVSYEIIPITRIGREILSILPTKNHFAVLERLFASMSGEIVSASINMITKKSAGRRVVGVVKILKQEEKT
ncbi:DUF2806 domain-containing protein [Candidatus Rariloculus sp.]|uniref:DUF2806 domain-containing protein n=1 Tax=Candidatus Rariloculus sp. TaxID=3101265 RepID=UPI003D128A17